MLDFGRKFILIKTDFGVPKFYTSSGTWSVARNEARVFNSRKEASEVNRSLSDAGVNVVETKG